MRNPITALKAARHLSREAELAEADAHALERLKDPGFADNVLIVEYLGGDLSSSDRERVEERQRNDHTFRTRVESLTWLWNLTTPRDHEPDLADDEEDERSWQKLKKRIQLEEQGIHTPTIEEECARRRRRRVVLITAITAVIGALLVAWLRP